MIDETLHRITPLAQDWLERAVAQQLQLTKPPGSLGVLEQIANRLAAIRQTLEPTVSRQRIYVVAADHGVVAEGVSAYPREVTAQMVYNFLRGGAAINVLARHGGTEVGVVDAELIGIGEMGIGNTTAASAIAATLTESAPEAVTGYGAGVDDAGLKRKIEAVKRGLEINRPDRTDALDVLAKVGGAEIGVMAGVALGAAAERVPIVADGFISTSAAALACVFCPNVRDYLFIGHRSRERGHDSLIEFVGQRPLLDLQMRLGEGTGAALAMHIIGAAARLLGEMATFTEAGVSDRET